MAKCLPIFAIKLDAQGDISLKPGETSNESIVWSINRGGAYMQTPLIYGDYLYNLRGNGALECYKATTGERLYREQVGDMSSFSASAVAADGKLYLPSEQGDIFVVKAGPRVRSPGAELHEGHLHGDSCRFRRCGFYPHPSFSCCGPRKIKRLRLYARCY